MPVLLSAGNLGEFRVSLWIGVEVEDGNEREIELEGKNQNGTYSVTGINAKLSLFDLQSQTLTYEQEQEVDDVPPSTDFKVNFGSFDWTKMEFTSLE